MTRGAGVARLERAETGGGEVIPLADGAASLQEAAADVLTRKAPAARRRYEVRTPGPRRDPLLPAPGLDPGLPHPADDGIVVFLGPRHPAGAGIARPV